MLGLGLGLAVAVPISFLQIFAPQPFRLLASAYERVLRSIPLLVTLFLLFYGLPSFGIRLAPFTAAVIGVGLRSSAYQSQIFRGAILSISENQFRAALSMGMNRIKAFRHIVMPQALRLAIPPWTNELTIVLKDTSMAFALGVVELVRQGRYIIVATREPLLIYLTIAAIYLILTLLSNNTLGRLERRLRIPGIGVEERAR